MSAPQKEYIYALYYDDFRTPSDLQEGPDDAVFYIGRTADIDSRIKQHRYDAKDGREDKYVFIRDLERRKIPWDIKELAAVDASDSDPWEFLYVIEFVRNGHDLKNMRYGDYRRDPNNLLHRLSKDPAVSNMPVLKRRLAREEGAETSNYATSEAVQARAILRNLRWLRTETETVNGTTRDLNIYDQGDGTDEIKADFWMTKKEVASSLTPASMARTDRIFQLLTEITSSGGRVIKKHE
ncbi:GIY-YIG nuclease family protein [Paraburkholderia phytofirmans]|uniref:GIY-YIG nuclease family protein n=1 Tax=Paraburkholderia phytofirmans TaxID=261302 RepID=UPI0038BB8CF5